MEGAIFQLLAFAGRNPGHWATLVGLFGEQTDVSPTIIDGKAWEKDGRVQDMREKGRSAVEGWSLPVDSTLIRGLAFQINNGMLEPFLNTVRHWAGGPNGVFEAIAKKAGWVHSYIAGLASHVGDKGDGRGGREDEEIGASQSGVPSIL